MYRQTFFIQSSANTGAIRHGLSQTAKSGNFNSLTVAVAYASESGCQLLINDFNENIPNWSDIKKEWLISLDFGITEPKGLELLQSLPNSIVKIPNAENVLASNLRPSKRFHSKLYLFEGQQHRYALFSGSANLTISALLKNSEQGISQVWKYPFTKSDRRHIRGLELQRIFLNNEFESASLLTDELLHNYATLRTREKTTYYDDDPIFIEKISNPSLGLEVSKAAILETATSFWVEVHRVVQNLGVGKSGNQIDLQRGSRIFFGLGADDVEQNTQLGVVRIRYAGDVSDYNMRFGDNSMDKLNLPKPTLHGIGTYENKTLLFRKNTDGIFDLELGNDSKVLRWKALSNSNNALFTMRGIKRREFGVF